MRLYFLPPALQPPLLLCCEKLCLIFNQLLTYMWVHLKKNVDEHFIIPMLTVPCLLLGIQHMHSPVYYLYRKESKHT